MKKIKRWLLLRKIKKIRKINRQSNKLRYDIQLYIMSNKHKLDLDYSYSRYIHDKIENGQLTGLGLAKLLHVAEKLIK